jgi:hypothetical protein
MLKHIQFMRLLSQPNKPKAHREEGNLSKSNKLYPFVLVHFHIIWL